MYKDNYLRYLEEFQNDVKYCIETGKRIVLGYTSDLDIIFSYNEDAYNELLENYLKEEPSVNAEDCMGNLNDLSRITAAYLLRGDGGEADITDYEVCRYLKEHFPGSPGLGGTCAQGAAALGAMGMPLIAHISDRCREVCEFMDYPGLCGVKGKELVPMKEMATEERPVYHMILQYSKGDRFRFAGKEWEVPCSNRLIMDYDTMHKDIHIDRDFREYLEENAKNIISYDISGFNAIVDLKLAEKRLEELANHYRTLKEKNPGCIFYFESAHYLNPEVKDLIYKKISEFVDILGMNEEELVGYTKEFARKIDKNNLSDVIMGMDFILDKYKANGIILHTKDYSVYYGKQMEGVNLEKGLTMGNLMSGTRARTGRYPTAEECLKSLELSLSETGCHFAQELDTMELKHSACLVPSRYMEKPKYTIGLGDTFVAGVQLGFVRTKRQ